MHPKGKCALYLARRGFKVFPLREDREDLPPSEIKKPALEGDWKKHATSDFVTIGKWWSERNYNIGVATLPGDPLVILDYDMKEGQHGAAALRTHELLDLPDSFRVRTASGGVHVYLHSSKPVPNSVSKIAKHVDVRGNERGGYVVGPGSTIHGKPYEITHDNDIAQIPDWTFTLATANRRNTKTKQGEVLGDLDTQDSIRRATEYLTQYAPEAIEGEGGNSATFKIACHVRDFGLSEATAYELLTEHWNEQKALPPWSPDELQTIVRNAYSYASLPAGVSNARAEFEAAGAIIPDGIPGTTPIQTKRELYWVGYDEGAARALEFMGEPLVDELLDRFGLSALYGKSNSGKTFIALNIAFHVATGQPWHGDRPVTQGLVVYVAAEGGKGIFKRVAALKKKHNIENVPLAIVPCPVNLLESGRLSDTRRLIELVRDAEKKHNAKCELLVIDTLSRALAGGDENASTDMGAFVKHVDRLRAEIQTHLMVVHHAGKDIARGARGWSGIQAAIDSEIEIHENRLTVTKQRDIDRIEPIAFSLEVVQIGVRPRDDKPVTSCVVCYRDAPEFDVALSQVEEDTLRAIKALAAAAAQSDPKSKEPVRFTPQDLWKPLGLTSKLEADKKNIPRTLSELIERGYLKKYRRGHYEVVDLTLRCDAENNEKDQES